ncbi:MAG: erythromycin esterase family protein [Proteobacteria bacterium]|nr:erythromycin esterase family protein [Pseudomonadota bacterium]
MVNIESEAYKIHVLQEAARPLLETGDDYGDLLALVGNATVVLLGEATHGSHEFYRERAQITKLLIRNKGFKAVAIEGDWPDAYQVNRFVRGQSNDHEAIDALRGFTRFPSWMWANADVLDFVGWLKAHNESQGLESAPVGFFGLDLYSLYRSAQEVIDYLERTDVEAAEKARERYGCLDRFGSDSQQYAYATALGIAPSCEEAVIAQLVDLQKHQERYRTHANGKLAADAYFNAEQNSRLVQSAEHYYRTMLRAEISSWNLRDEHMVETIEHIRQHLAGDGHEPKIVVWAHNSHIGDARATDMSRRGEFNIGELTRKKYGSGAHGTVSIGFTTYHGTVTAASKWDGEAEHKTVRPALNGSYEELFHGTGLSRFFLDLRRSWEAARVLREPMLERAIGVLYLPQTERRSHYFHASLAKQFDAVIHIDRTRAVEPIEHISRWVTGTEAPETYPSGV